MAALDRSGDRRPLEQSYGKWRVEADAHRWRHDWWRVIEQHIANGQGAMWRSRHARTHVLSLPSDHGPLSAHLKIYHTPDWRTWLKDSVRLTKARRAFRMMNQLAYDDFLCPSVLAVAEHRGHPFDRRALLLTETVAQPTLEIFALQLAQSSSLDRKYTKRLVLDALGAEVGRLHQAGYVHGDLVVTNILVSEGPPFRFTFMDHDRTTIASILLRARYQLRNLIQLNRIELEGITHADRLRAFAAYARARGWDRKRVARVARYLARRTRRRRLRVGRSQASANTGLIGNANP